MRGAARLVGVLAAALAMGCGSPPTHVYAVYLDSGPRAAAASGPVLLLTPPSARVGLRTSGLAYRNAGSPQELHYYAHHQWADTPAQMLEPLLVDALEASAAFNSVVDIAHSRLADWRLDTEVVAFDLSVDGSQLEAHVAVRARLLDLGGDVIAFTRVLRADLPARANDPAAGVDALVEALAEVLDELARSCAESAGRDPGAARFRGRGDSL